MGFWRFSEGSTAAELVSWVVCLGRSSSRAWRLRENSLFKLAVRMYLMFGTKNHKLCCNDSVFRRQQNQSTELNSTLHSYYIQQDRIENGFKYFSLLSLSLSHLFLFSLLSLPNKVSKQLQIPVPAPPPSPPLHGRGVSSHPCTHTHCPPLATRNTIPNMATRQSHSTPQRRRLVDR